MLESSFNKSRKQWSESNFRLRAEMLIAAIRPKGFVWHPGSTDMKVYLSRMLNLRLGRADMFVGCLLASNGPMSISL